MEALKRQHPSRPRNPLIADVCFKAGYIDAWGRGTLKIINSCREAGLPEPEMKEQVGGMLVTLFKDKFNESGLRKMGLNDRQILAVLYVTEKGDISNAIFQQMNHVGKSTATIDLQQLVDLEIFDPPKTKGRGSKYSLKK